MFTYKQKHYHSQIYLKVHKAVGDGWYDRLTAQRNNPPYYRIDNAPHYYRNGYGQENNR